MASMSSKIDFPGFVSFCLPQIIPKMAYYLGGMLAAQKSCQGFAPSQNPPKFAILCGVQAKEDYLMPAVMEAIDRMSSDERVKTMEYLWAAMTAAAEPESPAWHGDILAERRRRVAAGEEKFIPLEEAMRQLREEVACR